MLLGTVMHNNSANELRTEANIHYFPGKAITQE